MAHETQQNMIDVAISSLEKTLNIALKSGAEVDQKLIALKENMVRFENSFWGIFFESNNA
jgi:hypothetical protein